MSLSDMPLVRKSDGHKGLYGNILIVAGSLGKSGAAVMSGSAALWAGAGLVTVATPDVVLPIVAAAHPEYMTEALAATKDGMIARSNLDRAIRGNCERADGARDRARPWAGRGDAGVCAVGGEDERICRSFLMRMG